MALTKLEFRPGINRDVTSYTNEGGWVDGDKIRFRMGFPEKIGGWEKYSSSTFLGTCRALHNWIGLDTSNLLGIGTHLKYYIEQGQGFYDITPIRKTSVNATTFSASAGAGSTITVTNNSNGAVQNDFVTFSGAATLGGTITAAVLNQEYQILQILTGNSYTIVAKDPTSGSAVAANSSDTNNGGGSVTATYQINVGLNTEVGGTGWGAGTFGRSTWGSGLGGGITTVTELRLWSHDNFGEDLLLNPRDGAIFYWDKTNGTGVRAVDLTTVTGHNEVPVIAKQILTSDTDRHVIAFGTNPEGSSTQDSLLIRFSNQESLVDWAATATNSAGDLRIGAGSTFVKAIQTKREIVIWTDTALHSMRYIGPPFTFGIQQLASNITIMGPNAAVAVEDVVLWMGKDNFYIYEGQTQQLPCTVKEKVFFDFNMNEKEKVVAGVNSNFGEVIWFYPSSSSSENDSYVIYNYLEKIWYYGSLARTAWIDKGVRNFPMAADPSLNYLYNHEVGYDDDGAAMVSSIESSQIDIGEGDKFIFINRVIPDLTFNGSTTAVPSVDITMETRNYPGGNYLQNDPETVTRLSTSTTVPFETFTNQLNVRLRGRSFAMTLSSNNTGVRWRLGSPRVDVRLDGKR
jgi:hypothetical protein|tara:strand:+ start:43 stop:1926 length:1884 start_codon:yes stop_codon:yes gene_type:complete